MIVHWLWAICNSISEGDRMSDDIEDVTCDECLSLIYHPRVRTHEEIDD
jgi:hypothetical protein